jgi:hypothetical protein
MRVVGVGGFADRATLGPEKTRLASVAAKVTARPNFIFVLLETSFVACSASALLACMCLPTASFNCGLAENECWGPDLAVQMILRAIQDFR